MKLLLWLPLISGCLSMAVPTQRPMMIQEKVERLPWSKVHCRRSVSGNETFCIQAPPPPPAKDPVSDPDIRGPTQYCGYINFRGTVGRNKIFYWLVMADVEDPGGKEKNPLVVWMNGGPGVSSMLGLWDQWGPRLFDHTTAGSDKKVFFMDNPNSMTEKMTWLFVDQPAGAGFSHTRGSITNTDTAAEDFSLFIDLMLDQIFVRAGTRFTLRDRPLHIAGESYAGHYIPAIGAKLAPRKRALNLQSIFIGSAYVDAMKMGQGIYDMFCTPSAITMSGWDTAKISSQCSVQSTVLSQCTTGINKCRSATSARPARMTYPECTQVINYCWEGWTDPWVSAFSIDAYNIKLPVTSEFSQTSWYSDPLMSFLNDRGRMSRFGVDQKWQWVNNDMFKKFHASGDAYRNYAKEIGDILNAEIAMMLYAGDRDIAVPFTAVRATAAEVDWKDPDGTTTKRDQFRKCIPKNELNFYGKIRLFGNKEYASYVRAGPFYFVRVYDSGHMINENTPQEAKHLFETWVYHRELLGETFC